jgi:hypothetical protein
MAACSPEPEPGELCEPAEDGTAGDLGAAEVELEDPSLEVQALEHSPGIAVRELHIDAPFPTGLADIVGNDTREPVTSSEELQSYPLRTVVWIELEIPGEFGATLARATGFLVGPRMRF